MAKFRVTYATLSADNEDLHAAYEQGVATARSWLGQTFPTYVNGEARDDGAVFELVSPNDHSLKLASFQAATERDIQDAVTSARAAAPAWAETPWLEALGDVEEAADLIRYYCDQVQANDGFDHKMSQLFEYEHTRSVLRPYGVWAVISPFNFPMALAAGPSGAALVAGNTVLFKPSPQGSFTGVKLYECLRDAGVPAGAFHFLPGGDEVGAAIVRNPGVDGITFTGSYAVGMHVYKTFATAYPKPTVIEMGGKNPTVVSAKADLDLRPRGSPAPRSATPGRSARRARAVVIGDPVQRPVYMGPVIDQDAVDRYRQAVEEASKEGRVLAGGELLAGSRDLPDGNYVAATVVADLPVDHRLFKDELFVPFVAIAGVDSLEQGFQLANDTEYGLTAGFYSAAEDEVQRFLDTAQAGVVYVNRRAGATTGAWPGVQPFGGWKGSGSSGRAGGGLYYVQQFMREQSQTVIR